MLKKEKFLKRLVEMKPFIQLSLAWLVVWIISFAIDKSWDAGTSMDSTNKTNLLHGLLIELFFFFKMWFIFFLAHLFIDRLPLRVPLFIFQGMMMVLSVLNLVLIIYYKKSLVYLGADFFNYNWDEITQTAGASGSLNLFTTTLILMPLILVPVLNIALQKSGKRLPGIVIPFLLLACSTLIFSYVVPGETYDTAKFTSVNKLQYFMEDCSEAVFTSAPDPDIYAPEYMEEGFDDQEMTAPFHYTHEQAYPFLHRATPDDVLSPYFVSGKPRPDIVLIIVEGLGRAYHNTGAYLGSFTPFLDSLSSQSLYWENFLSSGGRTFAVLPSVLGSLPFGKSGFLAIGEPFPRHLSLLNILKQNGYKTSFYYGGDSKFDNMQSYLRSQHIDAIIDQEAFTAELEKQPSQHGFTWGYGDQELYSQYLKTRDQHKSTSPTFDILLTLATHSPFLTKHQQLYENLVRNRIRSIGIDTVQQQFNLQYVKQLATVMYSDHSLRLLFANLRSDPRYRNSIFIITGDHRMPEIPMATKLDRYHVPLIIYSPNLSRAAKFPAVSSHFDLAPSMLAFLQKNYGMDVPQQVSWIGNGLDTARYFRNSHDIPLMQSKGSAVEYVTGSYHLSGEEIFQLPGSLNEERVTDEPKKRMLQQRLFRFIRKNEQFNRNMKLYPDSLLMNR